MRTIFLDSKYFKVNDKIIDAFAPGTFKAKGAFETMLGLDGIVLDLALHLKRLHKGLKILGIKAPRISPLVLKQVLLRNQLPSARVRLMVWQAGPAKGGAGKEVHVLAAAVPYKILKRVPCRVCIIKTDRSPNDHRADLKSLDYHMFAQAHAKAVAKGFDEALLLNRSGYIFEASRSNVFWIKDNVLYTPPLSAGCLSGITRQQVIRHARKMGISIKEQDLTLQMLKQADAAFLTNSLSGIKPIEITEIKIA